MLELAVRSELPGSLGAVARIVGPIFCRTPDEQDRFPAILASWVSVVDPAVSTAAASNARTVGEEKTGLDIITIVRLLARRLWPGLAACVLIFVGIWAWVKRGQPQEVNATPQPATTETGPALSSTAVLAIGLASMLGLPLLTWLLLRRRNETDGDDFELRGPGDVGAEIRGLVLRGHSTAYRRGPIDVPEMAVAERSLARRVPVGLGGIDVNASVARAVTRPGEFALVPASRLATPDHLVLIDRASGRPSRRTRERLDRPHRGEGRPGPAV